MNQENQPNELAHLEQTVADYPTNVKDIHALADAYADLERWEDAIEAYKNAIALDSTNGDLYNSLGTIYDEVDKLADAEKAYQQAIALAPKNSATYYNLGCLYEEQQRLPEAMQAYKNYLQYVENVEELTNIKHNLPRVTNVKIRRIDGFSLAKVLALVNAIWGGIITNVMLLIVSFAFAGSSVSGVGLLSFSSLVLFPIGYGIMGFLSGFVIAAIYNFSAEQLGGIKLEVA